MSKRQNEKAKFRSTAAWKKFRLHMKSAYKGLDAITLTKLPSGWNLHHMDLNADNYKNLVDSNFVPLSKMRHELVHQCYNLFKKPGCYDNLMAILHKMAELNNEVLYC